MRRRTASTILLLAALLGAARSHAQDSQPAAAKTTILAAEVPISAAPGRPLKITYQWHGVPLDRDYSVFVHIANSAGTTVLQDDHAPPIATSKWRGPISYSRVVHIPATMAEGDYKIKAGLYAAKPNNGGWENASLQAGAGVGAEAGNNYQIGTLKLRVDAPPSPLDSARPATLSLKGFKLTFAEEFDALSVSSRGPNGAGGTRWIAHTPYNGDFGDARFADPEPGFPFTTQNGIGRITAKKDAGGWRAGLLSSADPKGNGFAQTYGYFEMRAKFPEGPGTWPAFWLLSLDKLKDASKTGVEVDVVEQYGHAPQILHATLHLWPGPGQGEHTGVGERFIVPDMTAGFHRYGLEWNKASMVWYFDGVELWRQPTPSQAHSPMYLLVDLALGGGWPIEATPNPRHMLVDYVRAYALPAP